MQIQKKEKNKLLLGVGWIPTSRWPTENELYGIFRDSISHDVISGPFSFSFQILTFCFYFTFFSFKPISPLLIYCGFWFYDFMEFVSVKMSRSASIPVSFIGLVSFCFVLNFALFWWVVFILLYHIHRSLFSNEKQKRSRSRWQEI